MGLSANFSTHTRPRGRDTKQLLHSYMITTILQRKIDASLRLIAKGERTALRYQDYGYNVAFSGGKDSQVIYELVKMTGVTHRLVHNFTTLDAPELIHFIRERYPECIIRRPARSFWQICLHNRMLPTMTQRFCCKELKESSDPQSVTITGVRHQESARRSSRQEVSIYTRRRHPDFVQGSFDEFEAHQAVEVQCLRGLDRLVLNPILEWSADDVFTFLEWRGVTLCSLYQTRSRIGCLFCPLSSKKAIWQDVGDYPKHYRAFLLLIDRIKRARLIDGRPDPWTDLTAEEVFRWWASKMSMGDFRAKLQMPLLPFNMSD